MVYIMELSRLECPSIFETSEFEPPLLTMSRPMKCLIECAFTVGMPARFELVRSISATLKVETLLPLIAF